MKLLKKLVFIIFVLAIIGYFGFNAVVQNVVEKAGTKALGVPVSVGFISLKPLAGQLKVSDLKIANPEGYKAEQFAQIGDMDISLDIQSLMGEKPIMIDHIFITSPDLAYEFGQKSNLQAIRDKMAQVKKAPAKEPKAEARKVVIKHLKITDATATPYFDQAGSVLGTVELADMELTDIGTKEKPVTLTQAFQFVFDTLAKNLNRAVGTDPSILMNRLQGGVKDGADTLKKNLDGAAQGLKSLFE